MKSILLESESLLIFLCLILQENSQQAFDIAVHGILLWASMGFLMPVGILTIRMSSTKECRPSTRKILFYVHAVVQVGIHTRCFGELRRKTRHKFN